MQKEKDWRGLTLRLQYSFRNPELLTQALTHPSCLVVNTNPHFLSYQTLEFVGDRVVNILAVERLYALFPEARERELEDRLGLLVSNERLAVVARRIELGSYLHMAAGAEQENMRENNKVLACAFEALAGALAVDTQWHYPSVKSALSQYMFSDIEIILASPEQFDQKRKLMDLCKLHFGTIPNFKILRQEGTVSQPVWFVEVSVTGVRLGEGSSNSRKGAEKQAAINVLRQTGELTTGIPPALVERRKIIEQDRQRRQEN